MTLIVWTISWKSTYQCQYVWSVVWHTAFCQYWHNTPDSLMKHMILGIPLHAVLGCKIIYIWYVYDFCTTMLHVKGHGETKWSPLSRWHFQMHFCELKYMNFDNDFAEVVPGGPFNNIPAFVHVMAWCRPGVIWTNDSPVYWRIYASLSLNDLNSRKWNFIILKGNLWVFLFPTSSEVYPNDISIGSGDSLLPYE